MRISFPWINSFGGKKLALYSVHYERACALYNYAVLLSQLGGLQNRNAADGIFKLKEKETCINIV